MLSSSRWRPKDAQRMHLPRRPEANCDFISSSDWYPLVGRTPHSAAELRAAYALVPSISIDYAVLERATQVAVVRARFRWSDVGSWAAVEPFWGGAGAVNAVRGRVVAVDATGCVVDSPDCLVALLGVDNLVVVDTGDVILVCPKARAQDVRQIVDLLRRQGQDRYL